MVKNIKYIIVLAALCLCCGIRAQITQKALNVGVMLPLHNVDGDGRRLVDYYRGILLAA